MLIVYAVYAAVEKQPLPAAFNNLTVVFNNLSACSTVLSLCKKRHYAFFDDKMALKAAKKLSVPCD